MAKRSATSAPTILLLAAGRSTRMRGADKLLEVIDLQPLIRLMAARCVKAGPTRVVLGPNQAARRTAIEDVSLEIVEAPEGAGMAASFKAGVEGLTGPVLVVLADMPEVTAYDLHVLLALSEQAPDAILRAATKDGIAGHPVLFPADLLPDLGQLKGDDGAKQILTREAARLHLVPLQGKRAITDLDTPEDWDQWRAARH
mgnify:CR=1 FL=1